MDSSSGHSTPPSHRSDPRLRPRSSSRLAHSFDHLIDPSSPINSSLQDLLLLSPPSSFHHPKLLPPPAQDLPEPIPNVIPRKKSKSSNQFPTTCASPRSARRARRRLEKEIIRDDRDFGCGIDDDVAKPRKRRQSTKPKVSRKERMILVSPPPIQPPPPPPISTPVPRIVDEDCCSSVDGLLELILELIMWKNVAKSSFWFGFGSVFFLSSWFSRDFSFSFVTAISHLCILVLAIAFFCDSFSRSKQKWRGEFKLTEDDVLRVSRVVLPLANAALVKAQGVFSGEPLMTLKVVPVLIFGAKFGHLITPWRISATGFFLLFTAPKLLACYSQQIHKKAENIKNLICEAWRSCQHKKFAGGSAAILLWNLLSIKARIFVAFISIVMLRYHHQQLLIGEYNDQKEMQDREQQQALVLAE
ncbi:Reticulon domain-containing protein [Dioscorea alata]|uniref:Reticulon domain-containing protein n=1 Tax=Dioscorea alata TaxID=55571 RepID=A0ACB7UCY2_DIOAL|nr:Reticulon domain-containing protein [Dioscorea alata]